MRREYHIVNRTAWQTRHLRTFVVQAAKHVLDDDRKHYIHVTFVTARRGFRHFSGDSLPSSGLATINGASMLIRVPNRSVDRVDLAYVIAHEMGHLIGKTHSDMRGSSRWDRVAGYRDRYSWAKSLPLEQKAQRIKSRLIGAAYQEKKLAEAKRKVAEWEGKSKRAQLLVKKWLRKVKYHATALTKLQEKQNGH